MTPLYQANCGPMESAMVCEGFLAEAALCAQLSHSFSQRQENFLHEREFGSRLRFRPQTGRWQTICYTRHGRIAGVRPVYCNYCRSLNPDDSIYCSSCGRAIKLFVEHSEGSSSEGAPNGGGEAFISEMMDSTSVAEPHIDEGFHQDHAAMDDEELGQLQDAYEKLRIPLPRSLHEELESRAFAKQLEEMEGKSCEVSTVGTSANDQPSEKFDSFASKESNPLGDTQRFAGRVAQLIPLQREKPRWQEYLGGGAITVGVVALIALGAAFIYGLVWVSAKLYPIVEALSLLGILGLLLCLPLSAFKRIRRQCGNGIVGVSYLWGLGLWMYSILALYDLWGVAGIYIGFFTLGFGTVPLACLALLFSGEWSLLGQVVLWFIIVIVVRRLGYWIVSRGLEETVYQDAY